jgi:hypothetical protein
MGAGIIALTVARTERKKYRDSTRRLRLNRDSLDTIGGLDTISGLDTLSGRTDWRRSLGSEGLD